MRLFTDTPHFYNSWRNMHCLACSAKGWESYVRIHTSYTRLWQECVHHLRPYTHVCGKSVCITYHAFSLIAASCDNLEICRIITATLEIYKCENMKLHVNTRCGTLQADVVEGLEVTYGKREDFTMLIWVSKPPFVTLCHPLSPPVSFCSLVHPWWCPRQQYCGNYSRSPFGVLDGLDCLLLPLMLPFSSYMPPMLPMPSSCLRATVCVRC